MNSTKWLIALFLAIFSAGVCIAAQGIGLLKAGEPFTVFPYQLDSIVEFIGFVTGVVGVYLMVNQSAFNYPVGLIWATLYCWFYFQNGHYGESAAMLISAGYLIDGWFKWTRKAEQPTLPIIHLEKRHWFVIGVTLAIVIPLLIRLLIEVHGQYVYWDATTTALGLTAQYLTNRKVFQSWYFWIVANIVIIPVFIYREWYPTAILYTLFTVMAFIGIKEWKASLAAQENAVSA